MLVENVYAILNEMAPFETAAAFDNVGLLVGDPKCKVTGIMCALDVTDAVLDEMLRQNANVLITHHPLMFKPISRVVDDNHEGHLIVKMLKHSIHHIAAHTNFDMAPGGTNDTLCKMLRLNNITHEGYVYNGDLPFPMTADSFADTLKNALQTPVSLIGNPAKTIYSLTLCSGGGSEEWVKASEAFLTGEIKYHHALEALAKGLVIFEAGHFATENPGVTALCTALQNHPDIVKWNVAVRRTLLSTFPVKR